MLLELSGKEIVACHLPFQHNGSSGDQSGENKPTSETRRAIPIVEVYPYSITNPMFLSLTVSLL